MLAIFALAAAAMYARVLPALLAVPLMALGIAAVAGTGLDGLQTTLADGTVRLAPVVVTVIFGALLSRVTLATGIAETIVAYAAEFGGDRPALLALALCAAVAVLFTSLTGLGAIIMVGSIVLPIMMTIGVPRKTAATMFLLAFALGFVFNIAQWTFYTKTFGVERAQMQPYALALGAIDLAALAVFAGLRFRATRGSAAWALEPDAPPARVSAPLVALATPVLPIVLYFALHANPIAAFAIASAFGVLTAAPRRAIPTLVAAAIRGVEDVAPAIVLFMGIGMLLTATALPEVRAALAPLVSAIAPRSWLAYVALFGVLSPLALYRGPLNPFGVGIAVYTVLAGLGVLPAVTLVAAVMAVVQVQNVCDPTNTQNVWVANFTGVRVGDITRLTLPVQTAVAILATLAVAAFGGRLLGVQPFHPASPASAATLAAAATPSRDAPARRPRIVASLLPGAQPSPAASAAPATPPPAPTAALDLYAASAAADTIAVAPANAASRDAAKAVYRAIARGGEGYRAVALDAPPPDGPCADRPFAAVAVVGTAIDGGPGAAQGWDTSLELRDCSGWPVDQWHDARDVPAEVPVAASALERAGLAELLRLRTWIAEHPAHAAALFARGLAYAPADGPTYLYTLFKTADGQMRAYVRPGGPAWAAGLRTNDVVDKLDGRFWWEYGTFQTQRRAYDGLPHVFEITRAGLQRTVALGAPLTGAPAER